VTGDIPPPAVVLVGHKCDLVAQRAVSEEEARQLATNLGMVAFVETSTRPNLNVEVAFQELAGGIHRALGQGEGTVQRGCGGIRLIPTHTPTRTPTQGETPQRC
ncbi:RAB42 protein, partial [Turnix velox]|nr:RAB42 protein [Turnix velox]